MLHREFTEAGEATRAIYFYSDSTIRTLGRVAEITESIIEWPISGDQLAALKADAKNREEAK